MGCGLIVPSRTSLNSNNSDLARRSTCSYNESMSKSHTIVKKIGVGSFSKVYLAKQLKTNHLRALKVLDKEKLKMCQVGENRKFLEGEIMKDLDHPNIVKSFEVFENDENYFISQEYISGCNLRQYLKKNDKPLTEEMIATIMKQLLLALNYLHDKGIVHRDIKPDNIFISTEKKFHLKLGDFGCALHKSDLNSSTVAGTLTYMPPETFLSEMDEKVDIWSCGVVLYVLLTNYSPYKPMNRFEFIKKLTTNPISSKRPELLNCPNEILEFLDKLLQINPSKRYSAKQALNDKWLIKMQKKHRLSQILIDQVINVSNKSMIQKGFVMFYNKMFGETHEFNDINKLFAMIDTNNNGVIEKKEFAKYLKEVVSKEKASQITQKLFDNCDLNMDRVINYSEFLCAFGKFECKLNRENIEKVFRAIDCEEIGFVSYEQIEATFGVLVRKKAKGYKDDQKIGIQEFIELVMKG